MRILTVASEVPPVRSGVARSVGRVVDALRATGWEVDLLSSVDAPGWRRDQIRLSALGATLARRRRQLAGYDLVHVHGPAPTISDAAIGVWRTAPNRPPLLYTHHFSVAIDNRVLDGPSRVYEASVRRLARTATAVVTTTASYRRQLLAAGCEDVRVIPWGVDLQRYVPGSRAEGPPPGELKALLLGQLRTYKGHRVAVEAVAGVGGVALTIAGSGPLETELHAVASTESNIDLIGAVDDEALPRLYADHDVVLLPSTNTSEAFGITLLEGMAAGCVPVASDLPGVADVAGPTGVLVEPGDSAALRRALVGLVGEPDRLGRARRASIDAARQYPWQRTTDAYRELIEELVDRRAR